jgi:hypothetical protein
LPKRSFGHIFGGATNSSIIRFDFHSRQFVTLSSCGREPENSDSGSGMIYVSNSLIVMGKQKSDQKYCLLHRYDLLRKKWFHIHVIPDSVTTNYQDGKIDEKGMFHLPNHAHSSMIYDHRNKKIHIFFGEPKIEPPPIQTIEIGGMLCGINLQNDLLAVL